MLKLEHSTQLKKDLKKIAKLPIHNIVEAGHVIKQLQLENILLAKYDDHLLSGN